MKTITFYNEKGGVGKSTYTTLYAGWLKYKHGINVAVVDLNNRIRNLRNDEIKGKQEQETIDDYNLDELWPIVAPTKESRKKYKGQNLPCSLWLNEEIAYGELKDRDVVLVDLPGALAGEELASMIYGQHIGMYAIPWDRDPMTIRATMATCNVIKLHSRNNPVIASFLTQVQTYIPNAKYQELVDTLIKVKVPILPDMISYTERIKNIMGDSVIRSTIQYPDWESKAFRGSKDLGIENLFIDITKLLNESPDHMNTKKVNLSFVNSLEKQFKKERQLRHSSFPKLEFPANMFE